MFHASRTPGVAKHVFVYVYKICGQIFRGLLQRAFVNQSADSLKYLCPYSAPLRHAHAVCAKEHAQTLAQKPLQARAKALSVEPTRISFAICKEANVMCCAFSSQMQTNDLPPCGAHVWGYAPIKFDTFSIHFQSIYPHFTHICPIYAFYTSIFMLSTCSFTCYKE